MSVSYRHHNSYISSRQIMAILLGLTFGFAVTIFLSSLSTDDQCTFDPKNLIKTNDASIEDSLFVRRKSHEELEREVVAIGWMKKSKVVRHRHIATELHIREKLHVSILTYDMARIVALNRTYNNRVHSRVTFYSGLIVTNTNSGLPIVTFPVDGASSVLFNMIMHVNHALITRYDWFCFFPDTTYIRLNIVESILHHVSVGGLVVFGWPFSASKEPNHSSLWQHPLPLVKFSNNASNEFCDFDKGIIISYKALEKLSSELNKCMNHALPEFSDSDNLKICLQLANLQCTSIFEIKSFEFMSSISSLEKLDDIQIESTLSFSPIFNSSSILLLHRLLKEFEIKNIRSKLKITTKKIVKITPFMPLQNSSHIQPIGVDEPSLPLTRYDVISWQYFEDNYIFSHSSSFNYNKINGIDILDIMDVKDYCFNKLLSIFFCDVQDRQLLSIISRNNPDFMFTNHTLDYALRSTYLKFEKKYGSTFLLPDKVLRCKDFERQTRLLGIYRRFDAARGIEYNLNFEIYNSSSTLSSIYRFKLLRPLGSAEFVMMPYVTESSRIHLVLSVKSSDVEYALGMISTFVATCIEAGDNSQLLLVLLYETDAQRDADIFSVLKSNIAFHNSKYHAQTKISWYVAKDTSLFGVLDMVAERLGQSSIIFKCTLNMQLSIELLNRVRMNTLLGHQVYFPIGYYAFKPNLIHDQPYPSQVLINQKSGVFQSHIYDHVSFYNTDYQAARKFKLDFYFSNKAHLLIDLFLQYSGTHVLRAIEPALRLQYRPVNCRKSDQVCEYSRLHSLASRSQLAMLLFQHEHSLDQQQLNVMHWQHDDNLHLQHDSDINDKNNANINNGINNDDDVEENIDLNYNENNVNNDNALQNNDGNLNFNDNFNNNDKKKQQNDGRNVYINSNNYKVLFNDYNKKDIQDIEIKNKVYKLDSFNTKSMKSESLEFHGNKDIFKEAVKNFVGNLQQFGNLPTFVQNKQFNLQYNVVSKLPKYLNNNNPHKNDIPFR